MFNLMVKVETLEHCCTQQLLAKKWPQEYVKNLKELVEQIISVIQQLNIARKSHEARTLNSYLALFLKDLFNFLDRVDLFELVGVAVSHLTWQLKLYLENTQDLTFRASALEIICDQKYYVPLNAPVELTISDKASLRKSFQYVVLRLDH